jgi:hypothetical protein
MLYELNKFLYLKNGSKARGRKTLSMSITIKRILFASTGRYLRNVGADNKIASPYKGMNNG